MVVTAAVIIDSSLSPTCPFRDTTYDFPRWSVLIEPSEPPIAYLPVNRSRLAILHCRRIAASIPNTAKADKCVKPI